MGGQVRNRQSFQEFYEQNFDRVFSFFKAKTPERETAVDLTHDVFLKAWQNWPRLQQAKSASAFLFTISKNTLIDFYRARAASLVELHDQLEVIDNTAHQEETAESLNTEQIALLHKAIDRLPPQRREIIRLTKIEGLSTEEAARHLSISKRTAENQIYRAMKSLRSHLAEILLLLFGFF